MKNVFLKIKESIVNRLVYFFIIFSATMKKGGNAVDAAIATMFCEGVAMSESTGLGGGFFLVLYNKTTGETWALDARETAPGAAAEDMYVGKPANASLRGRMLYANTFKYLSPVFH